MDNMKIVCPPQQNLLGNNNKPKLTLSHFNIVKEIR